MKKIRRSIKRTKKEVYMDLVCADIYNKILYITSSTSLRLVSKNVETLSLINKYQKKYPDFSIEVSDSFFFKFINCVPA